MVDIVEIATSTTLNQYFVDVNIVDIVYIAMAGREGVRCRYDIDQHDVGDLNKKEGVRCRHIAMSTMSAM